MSCVIRITHSVVSFFSSFSSFSCFAPGPDVCTPCDVTSGPRFCSTVLPVGEMLGLFALLLPLFEAVALLVSTMASLQLKSAFSLGTSLDFSLSLFLLSSCSTVSGVELGCNWGKERIYTFQQVPPDLGQIETRHNVPSVFYTLLPQSTT